jgi:hypothetical protein
MPSYREVSSPGVVMKNMMVGATMMLVAGWNCVCGWAIQ